MNINLREFFDTYLSKTLLNTNSIDKINYTCSENKLMIEQSISLY